LTSIKAAPRLGAEHTSMGNESAKRERAVADNARVLLSEDVQPGRDHIRGPVDAPVTLLEYGDYECPFCATAAGVVRSIEARMGSQLRFVFRHFPLSSVHPHAQQAAEAAEAAAAQRQFWDMHEMLLLYQRDLSSEALLRYAKSIGLGGGAFSAALVKHSYLGKVRRDFISGVVSGVNGTPSFYINGVRHDGPWDLPVLSAALMRAAAAA
jgi:protein-disulfide isomerase